MVLRINVNICVTQMRQVSEKIKAKEKEAHEYVQTQLARMREKYPTAFDLVPALEDKGIPCRDLFAHTDGTLFSDDELKHTLSEVYHLYCRGKSFFSITHIISLSSSLSPLHSPPAPPLPIPHLTCDAMGMRTLGIPKAYDTFWVYPELAKLFGRTQIKRHFWVYPSVSTTFAHAQM